MIKRILENPQGTQLIVQQAKVDFPGCCWLTVEISCVEDPRMKAKYAPVFLQPHDIKALIEELQKIQPQ